MAYKCFKTNDICYSFVKNKDININPLKKKIIPASDRFFWGLLQYVEYMKMKEENNLPFLKKIIKKITLWIREYFKPEELLEEYKEKAIKEFNLVSDYDEFKEKLKELSLKDKKAFGKLCERYFSRYAITKQVGEELEEGEYFPYYYKVSENKPYFVKGFTDDDLKVAYSSDWDYGREILEFKATAEEKYLKDMLNSGYCQALFYNFLDYNNFSIFRKLWRRIFFYKISVEVYVAEKNKVYVYEFELKPKDFDLIKELSEFSKETYKVDVYNLIKKGKAELERSAN